MKLSSIIFLIPVGGITVSELYEKILQIPGQITELFNIPVNRISLYNTITKLENAGFVFSEIVPETRGREKKIYLTEEGKKILREFYSLARVTPLPESELNRFFSELSELLKSEILKRFFSVE